MGLLNLEFLCHDEADLRGEVVEYLEKTRTAPAPTPYSGILKGRRDYVREVINFNRVLDVSPEAIG